MVTLQKPAWVFMNGGLCPWDEATLHISAEAITRGLNVYEGLKGYWAADGSSFGIVAVRRHYERLCRSARLLHIPVPVDYEQFWSACQTLVTALLTPDRDFWFRPTLYVVEGHWGENTRADLVITAFSQPKERPAPITVGVSTWQRSTDTSLPARIKTTTNYQVARLARIEGRPRGHAEMILLNNAGRVAEATGACVLMVRGNTVVCPPPSEGRLESITVQIVEALCRDIGVEFQHRPVERTELYVADELALAGTLAEIVPVAAVDAYELPSERRVLPKIADAFWAAVRKSPAHPAVDLTDVRRA